jgi:hypothetical protein
MSKPALNEISSGKRNFIAVFYLSLCWQQVQDHFAEHRRNLLFYFQSRIKTGFY